MYNLTEFTNRLPTYLYSALKKPWNLECYMKYVFFKKKKSHFTALMPELEQIDYLGHYNPRVLIIKVVHKE